MKKLFLTLFCALTALCAMAQNEKNYSEQYVPSVNGEVQDSEEVKVTVVDNGNGTVNVTFRDFVLHVYGADVPISKVDFTDIPTTTGEDGVKHFSKNGTFTIPPAHCTVDGKTVTSNEIRIKVSGQAQQGGRQQSHQQGGGNGEMRSAGSAISG